MNDIPQSTLARDRDIPQSADQSSRPSGLLPPAVTEYQTIVHTGDKMGAGTDALITMEVRDGGRDGICMACMRLEHPRGGVNDSPEGTINVLVGIVMALAPNR